MDNYPEYFREEEGIDIKKYLFQILYHWWWFAISIFIAMTAAYLVNRYSENIYQASCSIIIGEEGSQAGSAESVLEELSRVRNKKRKAVVENEISILKSYTLTRMAIEELNFDITYIAKGRRGIAEQKLYKNSPFRVVLDTTKNNMIGYPVGITILSKDTYRLDIDDQFELSKTLEFGQPFEHPSFHFTVFLNRPERFQLAQHVDKKYLFLINNINGLTNRYRSALNIEVNDQKGSILTLSMTGYVSQQVTDYLNKLSEVYIRTNLNEKNQVSDNTIKFIDAQLSGVVDSLELAGIRLQNFRSANKVIDLSKEGSFLFDQMEQLQSEKTVLDINLRYYTYLLDYIKNKKDYSDVVAPSVVDIQDNLLSSLVIQLNEINIQRRNIVFSAQENSPQVLQVNSQIDNIKSALLENVTSLIDANSIVLADLNERIVKIEKGVQKLPYTERQLINIQRKFNINDQIYTFLLQKRAEAGITKASNTSDHKILDIARPENAGRIKPKTSMNYTMALIIGSILPLLLIVFLEYVNNKITDRKDIEQHTNVPILGAIGHNEKESELPVFENPKSALAESFRSLRANLQYLMKVKDRKVISISSTISGEGKSFCAVNLAAIMAMAGKKTLLLSLDLRKPKVHKVFNIKNETGLSTFLIDKSTSNEIIHSTNIENLSIANAGPIPPNPAELIGSERMEKFMEKIKIDFESVIIDTPPVAIVTDALLLKNMIDMYIFVIRHSYSTKNVLQLIDELYNKKDVKNMAILVNDVQVKGYYGYNYQYGYSYGYEYGYYGKGYYEEDIEKQSKRKRLERLFKRMFKY